MTSNASILVFISVVNLCISILTSSQVTLSDCNLIRHIGKIVLHFDVPICITNVLEKCKLKSMAYLDFAINKEILRSFHLMLSVLRCKFFWMNLKVLNFK